MTSEWHVAPTFSHHYITNSDLTEIFLRKPGVFNKGLKSCQGGFLSVMLLALETFYGKGLNRM